MISLVNQMNYHTYIRVIRLGALIRFWFGENGAGEYQVRTGLARTGSTGVRTGIVRTCGTGMRPELVID